MRAILVHAYLDDWLLRNLSVARLQANLRVFLELVATLGWSVNVPKSRLVPSQVFTFFGTRFDLAAARVYPTVERQQAIGVQVREFLQRPTFTIRELSRIIGLLDATASVVRQGQWRVRPLHWFRKRRWSAATNDYEFRLWLDRSFPVHDLLWWAKASNVLPGVPLHEPHPELVMMTDASLQGWGAHVGDQVASGVWSVRQQKLHVNVLELLAIRHGISAFLPLLQGKAVQVRADNTTALAYLKKGGGTHSERLH